MCALFKNSYCLTIYQRKTVCAIALAPRKCSFYWQGSSAIIMSMSLFSCYWKFSFCFFFLIFFNENSVLTHSYFELLTKRPGQKRINLIFLVFCVVSYIARFLFLWTCHTEKGEIVSCNVPNSVTAKSSGPERIMWLWYCDPSHDQHFAQYNTYTFYDPYIFCWLNFHSLRKCLTPHSGIQVIQKCKVHRDHVTLYSENRKTTYSYKTRALKAPFKLRLNLVLRRHCSDISQFYSLWQRCSQVFCLYCSPGAGVLLICMRPCFPFSAPPEWTDTYFCVAHWPGIWFGISFCKCHRPAPLSAH